MWAHRLISVMSLILLLVAAPAQAEVGSAPNAAPDVGRVDTPLSRAPIPNQYIVVFHDDVEDPPGLAKALAAINGFRLRHTYSSALKGFSATMPPGVAQALALDPEVARVEQDLPVYASAQTVPTGVRHIEADLNPIAKIDGSDERVAVDVAVIDTGIDFGNMDLNVVDGATYLSNCTAPATLGQDDNGHGTHVAGTIGAIDNITGVVGVAPGVRLHAYKVLCADGSGDFSDVIAAINDITALSDPDTTIPVIEVINMSLTGIGFLQALQDAIQTAVNRGIVVVAAAGNDGRDIFGSDGVFNSGPVSEGMSCLLFGRNCKGDNIPAAYTEVATVSALVDTDGQPGGLGGGTSVGADDTLADFSNWSASVTAGNPVISQGAAIDLAGPGVLITSTALGDGTSTKSGTSMAAPHVAGAVALHIAANSRAIDAAGVYAIRQALIDCAESIPDPVGNDADSNHEHVANVSCGPPNDAPDVSITSPADDSIFASGATISFAGTVNDTEDGDLTATLVWASNIVGEIGEGGSFETTLSDGIHTITATSGVDTGGKIGSASISITVGTSPPPEEATTVSVSGITYATEGGRNGDKHLLITVALADDLGSPVGGASVSIDLLRNGSSVASFTGTTGTDGTVSFALKNAASGTYTTNVTNVTAADLIWDGVTPANEFDK